MRNEIDSSGVMASMDTFNQQAFGLMTRRRLREAFDLSRESAALRSRYGMQARDNGHSWLVVRWRRDPVLCRWSWGIRTSR